MKTQTEIRAEITNKLLESLREGRIPWRKPWASVGGPRTATNFVTSRPYSGLNVILTMLADYGRPRDVGNQIARLSSEVVAADMGYQWVKWAATETSRNVSYIQKVKPEWPGNLQDFQGRLHQILRGASESLAKRQRMVNNINQLMQLTKTQGEMRSLR